MQDGKRFGMFDDPIADRVERNEEVFAQTWLLRLVPLISVLDVGGGRRPDDDPLHWCRLRIRLGTSSHVMPTGPSQSRPSMRRSSSQRSHAVRGTASGT